MSMTTALARISTSSSPGSTSMPYVSAQLNQRFETYATAHEYLSASTEREPTCLVLDVHLGGMTGFDLHDRLLASGSRVTVVFITAHDEVSTAELERRAGPDGYLRKPFDGDQLLALVRRVARIGSVR